MNTEFIKLIRRAAKRAVFTYRGNEWKYAVWYLGTCYSLTDNRKEMQHWRNILTNREVRRLNAAISTLQKAKLKVFLKDNI